MLRSSLTEVDEQRNVCTKATFGDAVNAWMLALTYQDLSC